jgi:hypothetical protein
MYINPTDLAKKTTSIIVLPSSIKILMIAALFQRFKSGGMPPRFKSPKKSEVPVVHELRAEIPS